MHLFGFACLSLGVGRLTAPPLKLSAKSHNEIAVTFKILLFVLHTSKAKYWLTEAQTAFIWNEIAHNVTKRQEEKHIVFVKFTKC